MKKKMHCTSLNHTPWCLIEGALKIFKIWIFCIFSQLSSKRHTSPKGIRLKSFQYEMRAIFTKSLDKKSRTRDCIQRFIVYGSTETHKSCKTWKCKIGINWNFGNKLLLFISSDSCHKKALLKSLNIPLNRLAEEARR